MLVSVFSVGLFAGCACRLPIPMIRAYNSKIVKPDDIGNIVYCCSTTVIEFFNQTFFWSSCVTTNLLLVENN